MWQDAPLPRVTVIVATYNWSSVLRTSIASVLGQTFRDFELLVVGDGCTDDSGEVVAAFGDPRVRWINLPVNSRHQSGPNNEGLRQATGDVIAYLGHDDLWLPRHLSAGVAALDDTRSDLAYALAMQVAPDGRWWVPVPQPTRGRFASPLSVVHRRRVTETIGGWRHYREVSGPPDVELWRRMRDRGMSLTFVPRLTGVKFPASWRRGVYAERPCHEQQTWLARIASDPDFEAHYLARALVTDTAFSGRAYRDLGSGLFRETWRRLRRRFTLPGLGTPALGGEDIDHVRQFKGIEEHDDAARGA